MVRMEQLARRRSEQTGDAVAVGRLLEGLSSAAGSGDASGIDADVGRLHYQLVEVTTRLEAERRETVAELELVRE